MLFLLFPVEGGLGSLLRPESLPVNPFPVGQWVWRWLGLYGRAMAFASACWFALRGCVWNQKSGKLHLLCPVLGGVGPNLRFEHWPVNPFPVCWWVWRWLGLYSGALAFAGACWLAQRGCVWNRQSGMLYSQFPIEDPRWIHGGTMHGWWIHRGRLFVGHAVF